MHVLVRNLLPKSHVREHSDHWDQDETQGGHSSTCSVWPVQPTAPGMGGGGVKHSLSLDLLGV